MLVLVILTAAIVGATPVEERINLVDFARVVKYEGSSPETLEVRELSRGADGWEAWAGEGGQYMIGVEWDEPRDVAEVSIEFRHAIADRQLIQAQYWQYHWPSDAKGGWAPVDEAFHGKWVTAKGEWWAGDRDVSLAFMPYNQEQPGDGAPDVRYRRTYRLRFVCGQRELPPVRFLRAYGPSKCAHAAFEMRLDEGSKLKAPLGVSVLNGYVLDADGQTTRPSTYFTEAPCSFRVRYAEGDLDSPTRTIVTVREEGDPLKGLSFLPAEAVKYGIIRVPSLGVVVAHRGSTQDLQAGVAPGQSVFDRVGAEPEQTFERARREIPELKKSRQGRMYLPLGVPDARQEVAVHYDGSILLDKNALKAPADDSKRMHWPAESWFIRLRTGEPPYDHAADGNIKQKLLDGYLPVVINTWEYGGVGYEQTGVATLLEEKQGELRGDETVVLMSRLVMTNRKAGADRPVVRWRIEPGEALVLEDGHVSARGRVKDGKLEAYDEPRYRFHIVGASQGQLAIEPAGGDTAESMLTWRGEVTEQAAMTLTVPFVTIDSEKERQQIAALDFERVLEREAVRWRKIVEQAAPISVPEPLLNDFYKAQLTHVLISADRDPHNGLRILPAATYGYGICGNEAAHQIRSLEIRGLHQEAEVFLDAFLAGQSRWGLDGRFTDNNGVLYRVPTENSYYEGCQYNLDHGFLLRMLNEHYRFTRDRQWLSKRADAIIAACDFVTHQRTLKPEANTLGRDDERWGIGLLPPGHLEDPPEWLWWFAVNAYAYRGMRMTAETLADVEHPEAARIAADAESFGKVLRASCREAMVRAPVVRLRDGTYVPYQPTRSRLRGRDVGWVRDGLYGPVHLMDCGVYADDSAEGEWILRDAEDNVFIGEDRGRKLEDYDRQWFSWGGITLQSNLLPNPLVYLRRGQAKHAVRAFYNSLAANVYADVRTFCEHPIRAYGIGQGPFFKPPDESAFVVWLRHLLILEHGEDLELLAGVPVGWLEAGKQITMERAPTWFGPMNLRVESQDTPRQMVINLDAPARNPPRRIRLHLRTPQRIRSVTVNDKSISTFDADGGVITLPGEVGHASVVVPY